MSFRRSSFAADGAVGITALPRPGIGIAPSNWVVVQLDAADTTYVLEAHLYTPDLYRGAALSLVAMHADIISLIAPVCRPGDVIRCWHGRLPSGL